MTRFPLLLLTFALAPSIADAQVSPAERPEITTSARGEVRLPPDRAAAHFSIETRNLSAAAAAVENARISAAVVQAMRQTGLPATDITTASYSVSQIYENRPNSAPFPAGFSARNSIRAEVRRIEDVGRLIDAALAAGATQVSSVQFLTTAGEDARRRALAIAVAEARKDAEVLAHAAGGTLGRLIMLTSSSLGSTVQLRSDEMFAATSMRAGTEFSPRDMAIYATASGRWEFLPCRAQ